MKAKILLLFILIFLQSCEVLEQANIKSNVPYMLKLYTPSENFLNSETQKVEYTFFNNSAKSVKSITIVLFLAPEEDSTELNEYNFELEIQTFVEPHYYIEDFICFTDLFMEVSESSFIFEYFYVSRIIYQDDSEWKDPLGSFMFASL